jgi:hypothetical protein
MVQFKTSPAESSKAMAKKGCFADDDGDYDDDNVDNDYDNTDLSIYLAFFVLTSGKLSY